MFSLNLDTVRQASPKKDNEQLNALGNNVKVVYLYPFCQKSVVDIMSLFCKMNVLAGVWILSFEPPMYLHLSLKPAIVLLYLCSCVIF